MQGDSHRILRADLHPDRCSRRNTKRKFVKNAKTAGAILFLLSAFLQSPPTQGAWIEMKINISSGYRCVCRPLHRGRGLKYQTRLHQTSSSQSPPTQGAWIEMINRKGARLWQPSPPTQGAWIEILISAKLFASRMPSPPTQGAWIEIHARRGLRHSSAGSPPTQGAWIEMLRQTRKTRHIGVAPYTGGVD